MAVNAPHPRIQTFVLGDFQTNCFVVRVPDGPDPDGFWVIDCGFDPDAMFDAIESDGGALRGVLLTHAHSDHMAGVDALRSRFGMAPVWIHSAEADFCSQPGLNLSAFLGQPVTCAEPEHHLADGMTLDLLGTTWTALHAPGHSPGSTVFVHAPSLQAIVGDTIFNESIGRTDFPTSDPNDMVRSLQMLLRTLSDDMTIHPGHGPSSTIGAERAHNPFLLNLPPASDLPRES